MKYINFVHYLREPQGTADAKPLAVKAGKGDNIVPNFSTIAFAEIAGLPLVGEEHFEMPGIEHRSELDNGYGVVQFEVNKFPNNRFLNGLLTHLGSGETSIGKKQWIERYILGMSD